MLVWSQINTWRIIIKFTSSEIFSAQLYLHFLQPTENFGGSCTVLSDTNYLNNCGYNGAFEILNFIYGGHLVVCMTL